MRRMILTSAQSNTSVHAPTWNNVLALAEHYDARIVVGTYTYNQKGLGAYNQKGGKGTDDHEVWFDKRVLPYVVDERMPIARGITWCGELQVLPTAVDPLSSMEGYTGRDSSIFPHAKFAIKSVPSGLNEATKFMYTSGTVTVRNYIQRKAGQKAEFHHGMGCLVVEVDDNDNWWVRQVRANYYGKMQDLDVVVDEGRVTTGNRVEAIAWGDIHVASLDPDVAHASWYDEDSMIDVLRPRYQFFHDLFDGRSTQKHNRRLRMHHETFGDHVRGGLVVEEEIDQARDFLRDTRRKFCQGVVVNSNHDAMLKDWLRTRSHKDDPVNAEFLLEAELFMYRSIRGNPDREPRLLEWAITRSELHDGVKPKQAGRLARFLDEDESFLICNNFSGGWEMGMHGHRGPNGARGSLLGFARMGRKSMVGHSHTAGNREGCMQVGLSGVKVMSYTRGPSSWSHTHGIVYPGGKGTLVTLYNGKWRA